MITATSLELRAGPRLLLGPATFRIAPGDRVGLVGRNGAGKTTLTKVLSGETRAPAGQVTRSGEVGYLPQDPRTGDLDMLAHDRILSARGLDTVLRQMRETEGEMASADPDTHDRAMRRYVAARGGVPGGRRLRRRERGRVDRVEPGAAGARARPAAAHPVRRSAPPGRAVPHPVLRRRVAAARRADQPPRRRLDRLAARLPRAPTRAGSWSSATTSACSSNTVNRVFHLDANRAELDIYNVGWKAYLQQRETDERRRKRERANVEKQASVLKAQADRMRYKATKARAAQSMDKRAARLLSGLEEVRRNDKVAKLRFPEPAPCGKTPLTAEGLSKSYGSLEVFTDVDLAIDRGSRVVILGLNGAGKTTLMRLLAGVEEPDTGEVVPGHGLKIGYYAQEHETLDPERTVLREHALRRAGPGRRRGPAGARLVPVLRRRRRASPPSVLSGGEKTRLALATLVVSSANVLMLDEPTNNLDPASREEILGALRTYKGAVVLVTHDEGAVDALAPERLILLPGRRRGPLERGLRRPRRPRLSAAGIPKILPDIDSGARPGVEAIMGPGRLIVIF